MEIILVEQKFTNLTFNGKLAYKFSYDLKKLYKLKRIQRAITMKINKIADHENKLYHINIKFLGMNHNKGWMLSPDWLTYNETNSIENVFKYINDSDPDIELMARYFQIIVAPTKPKQVKRIGDTDDDKNDCLFNAINKAYNYNTDLLPANIKTPKAFKKILNLERNDKVPFDLLPKIEELFKSSFSITGSFEYRSKEIKRCHINLKCKGEHIELIKPVDKIKTGVYKEREKQNIYTIYFKDTSDVLVYNGKTIETLSIDEYKLLQKDYNYMLLICNSEKNLKTDRSDFFMKADMLIEETNGFINYYKNQYDSQMALYLFRSMSKTISEPEELDINEHKILNTAYRGGIHYAEKGKYKNVIDYDMNAIYAYYMKQLNFIFPSTKPTYKMFTTQEFIDLKLYPFGLYNVSFTNRHKLWTNGLKKSWYTHHDLNIAKLLYMTIVLVENETNALLYESKNCIRGNKAFENVIDYIDKLEKNKNTSKYMKPIRTALSGVLASKNKKYHIVKHDEQIECSDFLLESIVDSEKSTTIQTIDKNNIFKYSWARCTVFLTAYCRLQMIKILLNCDLDDIIQINTDGFISKTIIKDLKISKDMGDWKIKHTGDCTIQDSNVVTWK